MSKHTFTHKKTLNPDSKPTACVVRYGAIGDIVQVMSVVKQLSVEGYHITMVCQYPASDAITHDPHIDRLIVQTPNQIPIQHLGHFWAWFEVHGAPGGKRFDKWINLTESVESNLLIGPGNVKFAWSPRARHQFMNHNYLAFQHEVAKVKYVPWFQFYATDEEKKWRDAERARMRKAGIQKFIFWSLAGSSRTHKVYPHSAAIWEHVMEYYKDWGVLTNGDQSCQPFEQGFDDRRGMWCAAGKYTLRQSLAMMEIADVVVGPETGMMSAAAFYPMPKLLFLSHSTVENLSRDWVNTTSLWAPKTHCPGRGENEAPACHKMLPTFEGCRAHAQLGVAQCAAEIEPAWCWDVLQTCMREGVAPKWEPPVE